MPEERELKLTAAEVIWLKLLETAQDADDVPALVASNLISLGLAGRDGKGKIGLTAKGSSFLYQERLKHPEHQE